VQWLQGLRAGGGTEMHTERVLFTITEIDSLAAIHSRQGSTIMAELRRAARY
jgi:hypothetical protein